MRIRHAQKVSIHAPLARSNAHVWRCVLTITGFNTCSSCEEQPGDADNCLLLASVVSIHAPLARSNSKDRCYPLHLKVSIHAPLARSNGKREKKMKFTEVSIHAPLARSNVAKRSSSSSIPFQYMLLLRGATNIKKIAFFLFCFNTCSSCEEQPFPPAKGAELNTFQYMLLLRGATSPL